MIIIERVYEVDNSSGCTSKRVVTRKVFRDDDIDGVQKFLDERSTISGYKWFNIKFNYTKL